MPSPRNGQAATLVPPAAPLEAADADRDRPGGIDAEAGLAPHKPPATPREQQQKTSWIEIELTDKQGRPIAGEAYRIELSDGATVAEGTLDEKGFARVEGIDPGICRIGFPKLGDDVWARGGG